MTVAAAALALFVGAALQSATGFGFALVSAPILFALLGPRAAVTAGVVIGVLLNSLTLATERRRPQVLVREAVALVAWSLRSSSPLPSPQCPARRDSYVWCSL